MQNRIVASFQSVAVGDAMGKMAEGFWPEEVWSAYQAPISCFVVIGREISRNDGEPQKSRTTPLLHC